MHNLSEKEWLSRKESIEPWNVNTIENEEQRQIQAVLSKMSNAKFGKNCYIAPDCNFFTDRAILGNSVKIASLATLRGNIVLGDDVSINPLTNLVGKVSIGNAVRIASSVQIFGFNHGFSRVDKYIKDQPITSNGIVVGNGSWIGAGATLVDGVSIGRNCIIAAGAVVTKSFSDFSIIGGTPAKLLQTRLKNGDKEISLTYLTKPNDKLDFCVDLPVTNYIDSNKPYLDGWVATSHKMDSLYLTRNDAKILVQLNKGRNDVRNHLSKFRKNLASHGEIYSFRTPNLNENQKLVLKIGRKFVEICSINLR